MKNKLVSVVVPIYNTEKYLKRCVRSITVQSYKKLEIILVDDGSEDKSPEICDELSKKDCRIRVIHKKNGGLSDARNTGLFSAAGDYICFIDSDDFLASDFIETLLYACESYDCDIAQSGIIKTSGSSAEMNKAKARFDIFSGVDMIGELYGENYLTSVVAWNKLYRRKVFHGITYPVGLIREDEATTAKLFYNAKNVAVTKKPMYYYYENPQSIMRGEYSVKQLDILKTMELRMDFYREKGLSSYLVKDYELYLARILLNYPKVKKYVNSSAAVRKELKKKYNKAYKEAFGKKTFGAKRILMRLCGIFPSFYTRVYLKLKK